MCKKLTKVTWKLLNLLFFLKRQDENSTLVFNKRVKLENRHIICGRVGSMQDDHFAFQQNVASMLVPATLAHSPNPFNSLISYSPISSPCNYVFSQG